MSEEFPAEKLAEFSYPVKIEEDVIIFIQDHDKGKSIRIIIYGLKSETAIDSRSFKRETAIDGRRFSNVELFVQSIKFLFYGLKVKAVIVRLFEFQPMESIILKEFLKAIKNELDSLQLPYYFIKDANFWLTLSLVAVDFDIEHSKESVLYAYADADESSTVFGIRSTKNGIKKTFDDKVILYNYTTVEELAKNLIEDGRESIVLFFFVEKSVVENFKKQDTSNKIKIVDYNTCSATSIFAKAVIDIGKWIIDKSYTKFHVIPDLQIDYSIGFFCNEKFYSKFRLNPRRALPITKKFSGMKSNFEYREVFDAEKQQVLILGNFLKTSSYEFTVHIDINQFSTLTVKESNIVFSPDVLHFLPYILNNKIEEKIPVIAFFKNGFYILIHHGEDIGYKFMKNDNAGMYISFKDEKPKFGEDAFLVLQDHPKFVVWDLIYIMCQPVDKIISKPEWGFTITSHGDNPVMLKYDVHGGKKQVASPSFLMALLIKNIRHQIEAEMGIKEMPRKMTFYLLDAENENSAKVGIEAACALINQMRKKKMKKPIKCSFLELN